MKKITYITNRLLILYTIFLILAILSLFYINLLTLLILILLAFFLIFTSIFMNKIYNHNPKINDYVFKNQEDLKALLKNTIDIADNYQDEFNKLGYRISFDIYYQKEGQPKIKYLPKKEQKLYQPVIIYGVYELKDTFCLSKILYDTIDTEVKVNEMQNVYENDTILKKELSIWLDIVKKVQEGTYILYQEYYEIPYRLWKNIKLENHTWTLPEYALVDTEGKNEFQIKYFGNLTLTSYRHQLHERDDIIKIEALDTHANKLTIADNTIDTDYPVKKDSPATKESFKCTKCHNNTFKVNLEYFQVEEQDLNETKYKEIEKDEKMISLCYDKVIVRMQCTKCKKRHSIIYQVK